MRSPGRTGTDWEGRKESQGSQMVEDSQKEVWWLPEEGVLAVAGHSGSLGRLYKDWLQQGQGSLEEFLGFEEQPGWAGRAELWQNPHLLLQLTN